MIQEEMRRSGLCSRSDKAANQEICTGRTPHMDERGSFGRDWGGCNRGPSQLYALRRARQERRPLIAPSNRPSSPRQLPIRVTIR